MTNEQVIRRLEDLQRLYLGNEKFTADIEAIEIAIEALKKSSWVPITYRDMTEEEKKLFNVEFEETKILDCFLPDDGEEVLITTEFGNVFMDVFHNEIGDCYFEDYEIEDARAWMPLPEGYKTKKEAEA